jgi:hypothetical protein
MVFREVSVVEVREALRAWLAGKSERAVAAQADVDRKTGKITVIGVEPRTGADMAASLRAGHRVTLPAVPDTIADGLRHTSPARLPREVNKVLLDDVAMSCPAFSGQGICG